MGRRTRALRVEDAATIAADCLDCLEWTLSRVEHDRSPAGSEAAALIGWFNAVQDEWGTCGQLLVDGPEEQRRIVGHVLYAPPAFLPGLASLATAPASPHAVVLLSLRLDPDLAQAGAARQLVQAMAKDLVERSQLLVEAFGDVRVPRGAAAAGCRLSPDLLGEVGFTTWRPHPVHPRLRMDLHNSLSWKDGVEHAIERALEVVRPRPGTKKATRPIGSARVANDD